MACRIVSAMEGMWKGKSWEKKSQQCLGPYWALIFQRPKVIESQEYNQFIVDSFRTTDKKSMLSEL